MSDITDKNVRIIREDEEEIREHLLESSFKPYRKHAISYRSYIKGKKRTSKILSIKHQNCYNDCHTYKCL